MGSIRLWQVAQVWSSRCLSNFWRMVICCFLAAAVSSGGMSGGGGGTGVPKRVSKTHAPRRTGLVCWKLEVMASTAPMPRTPARRSSGQVTFWKTLPLIGRSSW